MLGWLVALASIQTLPLGHVWSVCGSANADWGVGAAGAVLPSILEVYGSRCS